MLQKRDQVVEQYNNISINIVNINYPNNRDTIHKLTQTQPIPVDLTSMANIDSFRNNQNHHHSEELKDEYNLEK